MEAAMVAKRIADRGPRAIPVELPTGTVTVYANAKVRRALEEVMADMTVYHGVRLAQVMEAIYAQGKVDGRAHVFGEIDALAEHPEMRHRNPGRPAKRISGAKKVAKKTVATKATVKKAPAKKEK
jgi:hypothetical protein